MEKKDGEINDNNKSLFHINSLSDPKQNEIFDNTNQEIDDNIKLLSIISDDPTIDIGSPVSFVISVGDRQTKVLFDTGAGANTMNPKYLEQKISKDQIISKRKFKKPINIQVGNSQTMQIVETVRLRLKRDDDETTAWFLLVPNLPMDALIGTTFSVRENFDFVEGKVRWKGIELPTEDLQVDQNMINTFTKLDSPPIHKVVTRKMITLNPRELKVVTVKTARVPWGTQGYIKPTMRANGRLLLMPGLVDIEPTKGEMRVLVLNPTTSRQKITAKSVVGELCYITKYDELNTEIIEFGKSLNSDKRSLLKKKKKETSRETKKKLREAVKIFLQQQSKKDEADYTLEDLSKWIELGL